MSFVLQVNIRIRPRMRTLLLGTLFLLGLVVLLGRESVMEAPVLSASMDRSADGASFAARVPIAQEGESASKAAIASREAQGKSVDRMTDRARVAASSDAKTARSRAAADSSAPPAPVTPVWRDDAKAIASVIESPGFLDTASPVARLYFAYFGRSPDMEGFDYYVAQREGGRPLDAISDEFAGSREIGMRYGELDNAAFVDRVFRNVFGDAGDAQHRAGWLAQLDSGAMTRGQMMIAFSESPLFRAASANEVFVSIAYTEIFGRSADPAELSRWVAFLDAGNSGEAVIQGLLASR